MELYITAGLIIFTSLSGVIFLVKGLSNWLVRNDKYIIAFSAGIFAVVTFDMCIESFELSSSLLITILAIVASFLLFELLEHIIPEMHYHEHEQHHHGETICNHSRAKLIWGSMFHHIGDGVLLSLAFTVDVQVGLIAALGIFIHEFVQSVSEFSVLKSSGLSIKKTLTFNFIASSTILIGIYIGLTFAQMNSIVGILFAFGAGAFLHLIFTDLIPHSIENSKKDRHYFFYAFLVIAGILTLLAVNHISSVHF